MPVRAVFDTNIWIAGLIWRGGPYRCLMLARVGAVQLVYCPAMTAELTEKLRTKFKYSEHDIRAVVYELNRIATRVDISEQLKVVLADPDDDKFIECAVVANAEIVVSEDKHLLELGQYQNIRILSATGLLTSLKDG